jgi:hypothetical protein
MQTTFIFLDLENVAMAELGPLAGGSFRIKVFMGSHQTKVPLALAQGLQAFGPNAEYIQMQGVGHNALDFHIAYYLGRLAVQHPAARFVIVSKDTGFDPLVAHLRAQKVGCERVTSLAAFQKPGPGLARTRSLWLSRTSPGVGRLVLGRSKHSGARCKPCFAKS